MAFLITSHLEGFSNAKGFMGLPKDSFFSVVDDINGSHVRIDINNVESVASVNAGIDLKGGMEVSAWLGYRGDFKSVNKPLGPVLEAPIHLFKQFKDLEYERFCASNGKGSCAWSVESWRFKACDGSLPFVILMDSLEEKDCFMCGDSSICFTSVNVDKTKMEISFGLVGVLCVLCCVCGKKRVVMCLIICKWCLPSGGELVVKRFERADVLNHLLAPFTIELAIIMAGCLCCEGNEPVLVYELMPNGSLSKSLHRSFNLAAVLFWMQRLNIVLGVVSAVAHLHEENCERQIIYTDVKTCNIMLNAGFNAKLGDFGPTEVCEHSSIKREATIAAGTMGFLAPECVYSSVPTVEADVYRFGVMWLDVATARKPVDIDGTVIVDRVWSLGEVGKLIEAASSRLTGKFDKVEMERMLMTGLACVHQNHAKRPTVDEAAGILQGEEPLSELNARKPRVSLGPVFHDDKPMKPREAEFQAEYFRGLAKYLSITRELKQPYHFLYYLKSETRVLP